MSSRVAHVSWVVALAAGCGGVAEGVQGPITLADTSTMTVTNGFGCTDPATHYTDETSFYRAFSLAEHEVFGVLRVNKVSFGVQRALAGTADTKQPARVVVHAYDGPIDNTTIDLTYAQELAGSDIQISDAMNVTLDIPLFALVDPGVKGVLVELRVPDGRAAHHTFYIGTTSTGETHPGYIRAPGCDSFVPESLSSIGFPDRHVLLWLSGEVQ